MYDLSSVPFELNNVESGSLMKESTEIGTYTISQDKVTIKYNHDFLTQSDLSSYVWMSGTLTVNTENVGEDGSMSSSCPAWRMFVVKARTNKGIEINKTAVKNVDNDGHVVLVDYTITITSKAVNTDVLIRDLMTFTGEDTSNHAAVIDLSSVTAKM